MSIIRIFSRFAYKRQRYALKCGTSVKSKRSYGLHALGNLDLGKRRAVIEGFFTDKLKGFVKLYLGQCYAIIEGSVSYFKYSASKPYRLKNVTLLKCGRAYGAYALGNIYALESSASAKRPVGNGAGVLVYLKRSYVLVDDLPLAKNGLSFKVLITLLNSKHLFGNSLGFSKENHSFSSLQDL